MRGELFSIQDLGTTLRIINERLKIISGGGFRSFDAATDAINLMAKFQVDTVAEAREAEREWIGGKRLERVLIGKRAEVDQEAIEAVKEETNVRRQTIDVSKPELAAFDAMNKKQADYVESLEVQVLKIKQLDKNIFQVTTAFKETETQLINLVETLDKAGKVVAPKTFQQTLPKQPLTKPPIAGGSPGGGFNEDEVRRFLEGDEFDKFLQSLQGHPSSPGREVQRDQGSIRSR
jgi:hypothetical protein